MKNPLVLPNRLMPLVMAGIRPPMAMSSVAGTRLWRRPVSSAASVPGIEMARFMTIANGATSRLPR